jgi:hypothetical protein
MKNINNETDFAEITSRVKQLSKENVRQWGKMSVEQMVTHCISQLRLALGEISAKQQGSFLMRTGLGKWLAFSTIPWPKGSTTPNEMDVKKNNFSYADFDTEKNELLTCLKRVKLANTLHPHPFFGSLSHKEWGRLIYKHVDHHLRQFSQ